MAPHGRAILWYSLFRQQRKVIATLESGLSSWRSTLEQDIAPAGSFLEREACFRTHRYTSLIVLNACLRLPQFCQGGLKFLLHFLQLLAGGLNLDLVLFCSLQLGLGLLELLLGRLELLLELLQFVSMTRILLVCLRCLRSNLLFSWNRVGLRCLIICR